MTEWSLYIHGKPFNIKVIQVFAPTTSAEVAEVEPFYEDLQDLLELKFKKDVLFIIVDWNAKVGSQGITWGNRQVWAGVQNEAGQRLTEFWQKNTLVIANTLFQQHKEWLYTWTSPDGQYQNQTDYILCSWRWRSSIQSAKTRLGAGCDSDHELLIAKFRLKLKKVGKTTRPFRIDLNQISYNYTVEVTNRFKGLDLPEELWMEDCNIVQVLVIIPMKNNCRKDKMVIWGGLTNSSEKKRSRRQRRKGKIYLLEMQSSKE